MTRKTNFQGGETREWTPHLVEQLEEVSNPLLRAVDFWIDSVLKGYIT